MAKAYILVEVEAGTAAKEINEALPMIVGVFRSWRLSQVAFEGREGKNIHRDSEFIEASLTFPQSVCAHVEIK